jgi:ABC-type branched-subunit amino acid transport system ATPase component
MTDPRSAGLEVSGLQVAYGGNIAVKEMSFAAPTNRITGLIGPNGAGKTTTFNACNGLLRPSSGTVRAFGRDITRATVPARAQLGIGRTFQKVEICNAMTVKANVALGLEARQVGRSVVRQIFSSAAQKAKVRAATDDALELCGISHLATTQAMNLTTGQRRLVELARAVAGDYRLLLLDEPSSGLDVEETEVFGSILLSLVKATGVGLLLVEHDMSLVMRICDYIYVLDFGAVLVEGDASTVRADKAFALAYLGRADPSTVTP